MKGVNRPSTVDAQITQSKISSEERAKIMQKLDRCDYFYPTMWEDRREVVMADREIVMATVQKHYYALQDASEELKK